MMLLHLKDDALSETKDVIEVCAFLDNGHRPGGKCPVMFPVIISASIDNAAGRPHTFIVHIYYNSSLNTFHSSHSHGFCSNCSLDGS